MTLVSEMETHLFRSVSVVLSQAVSDGNTPGDEVFQGRTTVLKTYLLLCTSPCVIVFICLCFSLLNIEYALACT